METRVGDYLIERELARGGMGVVYVARHAQLGRQVALKVTLAELAGDEESVRRFEREAAALAQLRHPNIVTVHEQGRWRSNPYLPMRLRSLGAPTRTLFRESCRLGYNGLPCPRTRT